MSETNLKLQKLKELGKKRQQNCYVGHYSIAEFHNGEYESDFVSPYSKSADNVNSSIVVLLQDWLGHDKISGPFNSDAAKLGHSPNLPTNRNLKTLLAETFGLQLQDVFATNVFPFIKPGKMNAGILRADFFKAYDEFCYPQIEIIKPKLVICCGKPAYEASLNHFSLPIKNLKPVCNQFCKNGILFYHQYHPGGIGVAIAKGLSNMKSFWMKMKTNYESFLAE